MSLITKNTSPQWGRKIAEIPPILYIYTNKGKILGFRFKWLYKYLIIRALEKSETGALSAEIYRKHTEINQFYIIYRAEYGPKDFGPNNFGLQGHWDFNLISDPFPRGFNL